MFSWRNKMKKFERLLLAALIALSIINIKTVAQAEGTGVSSYEELASAIRAAQGETHIVLEDSFVFESKGAEPQITIKAGNRVVLKTGESSIVLSHGTGGVMFSVEDGASLVLEGHENAAITLRETVMAEEWAESCIVADGKIEARNVVIEGFYAESGAAVFLSDRGDPAAEIDCILNECEFSGNHAVRGGALYIGEGRKAEINASSFTSNTAGESGNDAYVAGQLIYGDNNILTAYGPMDYETDPDGNFRYAGQICGTGSFELSERTSVSGVISWSVDSEVPESVEVILLADGQKIEEKTVQPDTEGYWDFSFSNLPLKSAGTTILYDIGTYEVPGFRFSKRGEADVGFEILYAVNPQGDDSLIPEMPEEQTEAEPGQDTSAISTEKSENAVSVTKSPTDEKTEIGGQAIFIAKAENSTGITWHLVSPDGTEDYRDGEISAAFASLELEGLGTERLKIKIIPLSLNGWKVRAEFAGEDGPVFSGDAVITVNGADSIVPEMQIAAEEAEKSPLQVEIDEAQEITAETETAETSESPEAEMRAAAIVELLKSPTNEIVELDGNAIFIARAENARKIIWHVISPDDTVDYADEQALTAFEGIQIEGLGTEKIKILHIPVAMNGWKVQAEFVGEANRVMSEKAAVLIKDFENIYQAGVQMSAAEEEKTGAEEISGTEEEQSQKVSPIPTEVKENNTGNTEEISDVRVNTTEGTQRSIQVIALWNDNMNASGQRPDMTIVELYRDDALYFTAVLNNSNNWMYSFGNLPEGSYRIKESAVSSYDVSYTASGDTVSIMHTFSGTDRQTAASTDIQPSAALKQPEAENNITAAETPSPAALLTDEPAVKIPSPSDAVQQPFEQPKESAEQEEDSWAISTQNSRNSTLMIWVGILGGFGVICAAVAVYLIRKMK